jgi:hypothetical protein
MHLGKNGTISMTHLLEHRPAHALTLRGWWWVVAVVAGFVLGPLDLWGQVNTSYPWAHLFNSPAVWTAAAFAYGRWVRELPAAAVGAVIVLVVGVEAYYLADVLDCSLWVIPGTASTIVASASTAVAQQGGACLKNFDQANRSREPTLHRWYRSGWSRSKRRQAVLRDALEFCRSSPTSQVSFVWSSDEAANL